jgi:hypothetical protein
MAVGLAGADPDRCQAGRAGELGVGAEALGAGDLADELGRGQKTEPGLDEQVRRDPGDEVGELGLERVDGDGQLPQAAPDARSARERLDAALGEVTAACGAYMHTQSRLNGYCDYRRHRRNDPALTALAMAVDRVARAGVPDVMPLPAPVAEEAARLTAERFD